jgi:elongation factor Ts
MEITVDMVKTLRERTGAGVLDCKNALTDAGGDFEVAIKLLRERGLAKVAKKASRVVGEGLIEAYVHTGGRIASLVELNCETDFVARTEEFRDLAHNIAMQVAAADPKFLDADAVPDDVLDAMRAELKAQIEDGIPAEMVDRVVEGRLKKQLAQVSLLQQPFIKDEGMTVGDLVNEKIARLGENIKVRRFVRYELGRSEE